MRDYAKVLTAFWTTGTGKQLRGDPDAQRVAFYLMTCPHGNMIGIFYLALPTMAHEIGMPIEGALKGLQRLSEEGFAFYDGPSEVMFLPSGARTQIGKSLKTTDKQWLGVRALLETHKKHRFYRDFLRVYAGPYQLTDLLSEAPSEPLACQAQAQEQCSGAVLSAQEQAQADDCEGGASLTLRPAPSRTAPDGGGLSVDGRQRRPKAPRKDPLAHQTATAATWDAYRVAYRNRYDAEPTRNAKVNGQLSHFVQRVPHVDAPHIAEHYVYSNNARYIAAGHGWGPLVQDAEKLRTEWLTGRAGTAHAARQADRRAGRADEYGEAIARLEAEDRAIAAGGAT